MRENEDAIAIYSRKSRFTGKGESIGNQVELAKEYIRVHFGDDAVKKPSSMKMKAFPAEISTDLPSKGCWKPRNSESSGRLWFTGWTVSAAMSATSPA